jgi:hypothetical protein
METTRLVMIVLILGAIGPVLAGAGEAERRRPQAQPVKIIDSWSGKLRDAALQKLQPPKGFVLDQDEWATLWTAWRKQGDAPPIDFQKQMVLVFTAGGPNSVGCTPTIDGKGNVRAEAMSTLIGGPGFGYLMLCVSREGVKTVNGIPLPGERVRSRKLPQGRPGFEPGAPPQDSASSPPARGSGVEAGAQPEKAAPTPPIKALRDVAPNAGTFEGSSWSRPLVLRSAKDAAAYFSAEQLAKLAKQVDFAEQIVLVFAWRGSGQDRLEHAVAESFPEQVFFTYKAGRTRDLRAHVHVYALRSNVKWSVMRDVPGKGKAVSPDTPVQSPGHVPGAAEPGTGGQENLADPIVHKTAEQSPLIMGLDALPHLQEQRAKASPELQ